MSISARRDSILIDKLQIDSVYLRDSIFIKEKSDTVYVFKDRYKTAFKTRIDTIVKTLSDTVVVKSVEIKEVERRLGKVNTFFLVFGKIVCGIGVAYLLFKLIKNIKVL